MDYLGQPFQDWLEQPDQFMEDADVSVLAHVAENFVSSGTSKWHYPTVEWLVVYILTEAAVVPHNIRQGRNSTSLLTAYQDIARELVSSPLLPPPFVPFPSGSPHDPLVEVRTPRLTTTRNNARNARGSAANPPNSSGATSTASRSSAPSPTWPPRSWRP